MLLAFIHLFFCVINSVEARLEKTVIALKDPDLPNYTELNRDEHEWSGIYYLCLVILAVGVSVISMGISWKAGVAALSLLVNRRIFFEYALKLFRKRPFKAIEGDQPIDTAIRKILGPNGGHVELVLLFMTLIVSYFIIF